MARKQRHDTSQTLTVNGHRNLLEINSSAIPNSLKVSAILHNFCYHRNPLKLHKASALEPSKNHKVSISEPSGISPNICTGPSETSLAICSETLQPHLLCAPEPLQNLLCARTFRNLTMHNAQTFAPDTHLHRTLEPSRTSPMRAGTLRNLVLKLHCLSGKNCDCDQNLWHLMADGDKSTRKEIGDSSSTHMTSPPGNKSDVQAQAKLDDGPNSEGMRVNYC